MSSDSEARKTETPFKHPQCGGLILMVEEEDRTFYQCDTCDEASDQLERLAVGKPVILRRRRTNQPKKKLKLQESQE